MKKPPEELAEKLIAASESFGGTGLDISVDEVAEAADVPRATLYYYFSGKDDLVAFFINDKLERMSTAITKAAAGEGTVVERLAACVRSVLTAYAEFPVLCTELPVAMRRMDNHAELAMNTERVMMAPVRELLIEGRATGELAVADVGIAATALFGTVGFVAMQLTLSGQGFDPDALADVLIPQILDGLRGR